VGGKSPCRTWSPQSIPSGSKASSKAIYRRPYDFSCSTSTARDLLTSKKHLADSTRWRNPPFPPIRDRLEAEARTDSLFRGRAYDRWGCLHEYRSVGIDSAPAVWGRIRFQPVGGGAKNKAVRLTRLRIGTVLGEYGDLRRHGAPASTSTRLFPQARAGHDRIPTLELARHVMAELFRRAADRRHGLRP
jgi:hypothetical protein